MDNFRKRTPQQHARKAIDGFLNAPVNRQNRTIQPGIKRPDRNAAFGAGPVSPRRRIVGDFKSTEGFTVDGAPTAHRMSGGQQPPTDKNIASRRPQFGDATNLRRGHHKEKKQHRFRKFALRGSFAVIIVAVALTGFLATKGYLRLNQIFKGGGAAAALEANVDPSKLRGEGDGRINVLILGRGGAGHDGPDLTDTLVVASIDPVNKKAALLSVPRDTWVHTKYGDTKINAVFANAKSSALRKKGTTVDSAEKVGINAIESEIEDVLGINIHYYSMVDFEGFREAVDTVGGVTINVPEELRDPTMAWENNRNPVLAKAGVQTMDGRKALMYVRSRHGSARGDFDRAERQRLFLVALKSKIFSTGTYSNPLKVSKLMDNFGNHAKTDFSLNDLMRLYTVTKGISNSNVKSIGLADPPNDYLTTGSVGNQSIVRPRAPSGLFEYDEIHKYIRSQLPDGYVQKENAPITVLNGTLRVGLATNKADELRSYGYNVTKVDNAPTKDYTHTVIVDLTGKNPYSKNYLEKRFHTSVTRELPQGITLAPQDKKGFLVIIGSNETANL
jgi:LCP family protein required for cell wall assembly